MRSSNVVLAAGWNSRIYLWEDMPNKMEVRQYRTFDGHEHDINCMAFQPPQLLASGDFGGCIHVWNIYSGDKRVSIQLDKDEKLNHWDLSVEELLFMPGRVKGGKPRAEAKPGDPLGILMAGVDGSIRLFDVTMMPRSKQVMRVNVTSGSLESVCCMSMDIEQRFFVIGDTSGHVRVWDISKLDMANLPENAEDCFVQIAHFRAHQEGVTSVSVVLMGDKEGSTQGRSYIVAGSSDTTVSMWTTTGVQLGTFGRGGSWDTSDPASWVGVSDDAKALEMDSLYYKSVAADAHEDAGSEEEQPAVDEIFEGLDPAGKVLAQRRMAHILGKTRNPINAGVHSNLLVHGITDVPDDFEEVRVNYGGAHRERKQKGRRTRRGGQ